MKFEQHQLANGLQILVESNPDVHSVAVGFFVRAGSRDESPELSGVSHFLEHMTFKGTDRYTAEEVNRILDDIGADSNASTGDEITQYYAVCLPEFVPTAIDLLADIVFPSLREEDFDLEKNVILEEIGMYADQPAWVGYEAVLRTHFGSHALGQPILGTNDSVTALTAKQMQEYHRDRYKAGNIVLTVTGNIDASEVVRLAEASCSQWPAGTVTRTTDRPETHAGSHVTLREQSLQQHVYQITPGPSSDDVQKYAAELLMTIVGDDSGSRLFWELVDPGKAEVAEVGFNEYEGYGCYMLYMSCRPEEAASNLERIGRIFDDVNLNGITDEELQRAKNKIASRIVLRGERPAGRMRSVAENWIYRGEYRSVDDQLARLEGITRDSIEQLLKEYPLGQYTTATIGPLEELVVADQ